jgi:uncharacterized membrane protein YoaK (UPF0700 family)
MVKARAKDLPGSLVDRDPDEASKTAKRAAKALGNAVAGAIILSAVAGFVDTAGFLGLFGLFTAHVTGDLVTAAATMTAGMSPGVWAKLAMVPVFMASVSIITLFARAIGRRGAATLAPLLFLMALALAAFGAAGFYLAPFAKDADAPAIALIGALGVFAMGIQNALMKGALKSFSQTTLMTGNLTQFTIDLTEFFWPAEKTDVKERARMRKAAARDARKTGFPLLGFMAGAAAGAFGMKLYGFLSMGAPALAVLIMSLVALIRSRERRRARRATA